MAAMKAELLMDRLVVVAENAFVEMVSGRLAKPVEGSTHGYKYRLAYVVDGRCVLRYDNETGKGDHRHVDGTQSEIVFPGPDQLLADFLDEVRRWNDENLDS